MTFAKRAIKIILSYGTGKDGMGAPETFTLENYRVSLVCGCAGTVGLGQAQVRVYGVDFWLMNRLSTLGQVVNIFRNNKITIIAGDDIDGMFKIWEGTIYSCWADMNGVPDTSLNFSASAGGIERLIPLEVKSFTGSADAAEILAGLAADMGLEFVNDGVSVQLSTPYFYGSGRQQAESVVRQSGIEWNGIENGVLAIWPRGGYRQGSVPLISVDTGMVGYPTYNAAGVNVTTQFNPSIKNGGLIEVKSTLVPASSKWRVLVYQHDLEADLPGGKWFTSMQAYKPEIIIVR